MSEAGPLLDPEADPITEPIDVKSIRVAVAQPPLPEPVAAPRATGPAAPWNYPATPHDTRRRLRWLQRQETWDEQDLEAVN